MYIFDDERAIVYLRIYVLECTVILHSFGGYQFLILF